MNLHSDTLRSGILRDESLPDDAPRSDGLSREIAHSDILCGDIGGTHTRLAILRPKAEGGFEKIDSVRLRSAELPSLRDAVSSFLRSRGVTLRRAAFGVAGPVIGGEWQGTNLDWNVSLDELHHDLEFQEAVLLNDLEALAWGIPFLGPEELVTLHAGVPRAGNRALGAAGTGFGQAGLYWDGHLHRPFATEGGHTSFGPRNELEIDLLRFLWQRYQRDASWERVVSGMGLANLFDFFVDRGGQPAEELRPWIGVGDRAAIEISRAAIEGRCAVADQALHLFVELFGAEMGNLALKTLALGGVYLGGGITPQILDRLRGPSFRKAFCDKGRMGELLASIPVHAIIDGGDSALFGAAKALAMASEVAPGHPCRVSADGVAK